MKIRSGPNLARNPQPGLQIPELFSGPHSGTFFCTFFVAFPGNSSNNVDPADQTLFVAFPGTSTILASPGMPSLGSCRHYLLSFLEMQQVSSGQRGRHYLRNLLDMRRKMCRRKFWKGAQKTVPESAGLFGGSGQCFGPDLTFKSGEKHQNDTK